ncbi:pre-mRNA-splicing factor cwc22 [Striga asiatica]|uniref:Pre-mRNA-splicing factor cwc22 n=1 Tax=Striga asiatica TaxID=4170 RepID=A0A5A7RKU0_STRAF|nr:pre-mRNA-splicing factor cwc22 [Striga asiatica]
MNSPNISSDFSTGVSIKQSEYQQRLKWLSTASKIVHLVWKLDSNNIRCVADEIMSHDVVWCRGPFCQAVMLAQSASPSLTTLYAALVAAVNSRFPDVGLLLVKRVVLQLRTAYNNRDRKKLLAASRFVAQLVNQEVAYEVLDLDVLQLLLIGHSHTTVYVAVRFCVECGSLLKERAPYRLRVILMEFRLMLRKGSLSRRAQVSIKRLLGAAKGNRFRRYSEGLEVIVEDCEGVTHEVSLLHDIRAESSLDSFQSGHAFDDECELFSRMKIGDGDGDDSGDGSSLGL